MKEFNKETFLNDINAYPGWVKDMDDALKYASHISYRMYQTKARLDYVLNELKKHDPKFWEDLIPGDLKIINEYNQAYNEQEN